MARTLLMVQWCCAAHVLALWAAVLSVLFGWVHRSNSTPSSCVPASLVLCSENVLLPHGIRHAWVHVAMGTIARVQEGHCKAAAHFALAHDLKFLDFGSQLVAPGLIDTHVHISELGRRWEGYSSATQAAAAGGVTTIIGMPLNSIPPTTTLHALQQEVISAEHTELFADVGYWAGLVPDNTESIGELLRDERVLGAKAFLSPLPPSAGFTAVGVKHLLEAGPQIEAAQLPLLVHCELMDVREQASLEARAAQRDSRSFQNFMSTRPREFEEAAIRALISVLGELKGLRAHIVHLSDAGSLDQIRRAQQEMPGRLSVESCPHYLRFAGEEIPAGATRLKSFPPIRSAANREQLWEGLADGTIGMITSDHSPCEPSMRKMAEGDFLGAWAGVSGLQNNLAATWDAAAARNFTTEHIAKWWSQRPAQLAGIWAQKGSIEPGKDADFVIWDPNKMATTDKMYHRHPGSPYAGQLLRGEVRHTFVRGHHVFEQDRDHTGAQHGEACGKVISRDDSRPSLDK